MTRYFSPAEFDSYPEAASLLHDFSYLKITADGPFSLESLREVLERRPNAIRYGLYGAELDRILKIIGEAMAAIESSKAT